MYAALGVHPSESAELSDEGLKDIETWCTERQDGKVRAIGEIGLDYYWEEPDKDEKIKLRENMRRDPEKMVCGPVRSGPQVKASGDHPQP